jgi:hypothetical protein
MQIRTFVAVLATASAISATPAFSEHLLTRLGPDNLNSVVGDTVLGAANANLGVVSRVDPATGTITVTGRHGELANISSFWAGRDGLFLRAPALTAGDIAIASNANLFKPGTILGPPSVIVVEPPAG